MNALEKETIPEEVQLEDVITQSIDTSLTNNVSPDMTPKVRRKREKSLFIPLTQMDDKQKPAFLLQSNKKRSAFALGVDIESTLGSVSW